MLFGSALADKNGSYWHGLMSGMIAAERQDFASLSEGCPCCIGIVDCWHHCRGMSVESIGSKFCNDGVLPLLV